MKFSTLALGLLTLVSSAAGNAATEAPSSTSKAILPSTFKPPAAFNNVNLVHIISLEKNYVKESINVLVENVGTRPHNHYFIPFTADQMSRVGGFEVKDRKNPNAGPFVVHAVEFDPKRCAVTVLSTLRRAMSD